MSDPTDEREIVSRRDFLRSSAVAVAGAVATGAWLAAPAGAYAAGSDTIRVGVIGCGGRGTGAARDIVAGAEGIDIVAMGDLFPDRLARSRAALAEALGAHYRVDDDHAFTGFDAYERVLASGVDLVILATPPGFRPAHLEAAVAAGKHIFAEKPVAVDPAGIRAVVAAAELASRKGLAIVAGTQRRHQAKYREAMARLEDGAIGEAVGGSVYWNQGGLWSVERTNGMSDMEWQCRNWLYFAWLSGDHIVEQHMHNIDVANWVFGAHPVSANGVGGRQSRTDPKYGHVYDHFAVELEYPSGARVLSMCRQQDGTTPLVAERFTGTHGTFSIGSGAPAVIRARGSTDWTRPTREDEVSPYVQEHTDLVASLRAGAPLNELRQVAESTLTAIMAREAAYTGEAVTWSEIMASGLDLTPGPLGFGPLGVAPVALPGVTRLERPALAHSVTSAG